MQTIILAGGKGARLKPYTTVFPKPLMPVGDYPILEIVIKQLAHHGFDQIIMAVGHLKELIIAFLGTGEKWNVQISYSFEKIPLGTAGPLKLIQHLDDQFMVMNGDILTNMDFYDFFEYHKKTNGVCTISSYKKPVVIDLGVLKKDEHETIKEYIEKPTLHYDVSMGIYAFHKSVLEYIPDNQYFDFPELIKTLLKKGVRVSAYPFEGIWMDIGRSEDYEKANQIFENNKSEFLMT